MKTEIVKKKDVRRILYGKMHYEYTPVKMAMRIINSYRKGMFDKAVKHIAAFGKAYACTENADRFYMTIHDVNYYGESEKRVNEEGVQCNQLGMTKDMIVHCTLHMYPIISEYDKAKANEGEPFYMKTPYPSGYDNKDWWCNGRLSEFALAFEKAYSWFDFNLDFERFRLSSNAMLAYGIVKPPILRIGDDLASNYAFCYKGRLIISSILKLGTKYEWDENFINNL